jgi:hypothetical protein
MWGVAVTWTDPNGSSLLGPSSEWLWTALSTVAVIVSLIAIFRELKLQTGLKDSQQLHDVSSEWEAERMARYRLSFYLDLRSGVALSDMEAPFKIINFWEYAGSLVHAGHMSRDQLCETLGGDIAFWWCHLEEFVRAVRLERRAPTAAEHFEWLANQVRKSRHDFSWHEQPLTPERIGVLISEEQSAISMERSLRPGAE